MNHKHTKEEMLAFLEYLKEKKDVILDQQEGGKKIFHISRDSSYYKAKQYLAVLMASKSTLEAYRTLAHLQARKNPRWKIFPEGGYLFKEDWEELREHTPWPLPENVARWEAEGTHVLESRQVLFDLFPTEYLLFQHGQADADEPKITVREVSLEGAYHYYRAEKNETDKLRRAIKETVIAEPRRVTLCFSSEESGITMEQVISMSKFLCETHQLDQVHIVDHNKDTITVIRRNQEDLPM